MKEASFLDCDVSCLPGPGAELDFIPTGRALPQDKYAVPRSKVHTQLPIQKPAGKMQERQSGGSAGPALWIKNNSRQNEEVETVWRLKKNPACHSVAWSYIRILSGGYDSL